MLPFKNRINMKYLKTFYGIMTILSALYILRSVNVTGNEPMAIGSGILMLTCIVGLLYAIVNEETNSK